MESRGQLQLPWHVVISSILFISVIFFLAKSRHLEDQWFLTTDNMVLVKPRAGEQTLVSFIYSERNLEEGRSQYSAWNLPQLPLHLSPSLLSQGTCLYVSSPPAPSYSPAPLAPAPILLQKRPPQRWLTTSLFRNPVNISLPTIDSHLLESLSLRASRIPHFICGHFPYHVSGCPSFSSLFQSFQPYSFVPPLHTGVLQALP